MTGRPGSTGGPATTAAADPRYARQITVPGVGAAGQAALAAARVLCIGAGGLGSPAALYLAAAGVGTLGIVDDDLVELTNLHRQILHAQGDIGARKVESAARTLTALNPEVTIRRHHTRLTAANALDLMCDYDIVLDGADNFETRYLASDATTLLDLPHVWASVLGAGGQLSVFHASRGPILRDLFPDVPAPGSVPTCAEAGVLGVVPGILGVAMAAEALKLILGWGQPLIGIVSIYDMRSGVWDQLTLRPNPAVARPRTAAEVGVGLRAQVTAAQLAARLVARDRGDDDFTLIDVREPEETRAATIPGAELVPMSRLFEGDMPAPALRALAQRVRSTPGDTIVYCRAGGRSARASAALAEVDAAVVDLVGGIDAWHRREPDPREPDPREPDPRDPDPREPGPAGDA